MGFGMLPLRGEDMKVTVVIFAIVALGFSIVIWGQAPRGQGRGGGAQLPAAPLSVAIPSFKAVTGPGAVFPGLQKLPPGEDLDHFKYVVKEYFISGTAQGQPYTTRVLVRRPMDVKKFS